MRQWESGPWYIMRMKLPVKRGREAAPGSMEEIPKAEYLCTDGWKMREEASSLREFTTPATLDTMMAILKPAGQETPYRPSDPQLPEYDYVSIPRDQFFKADEKD